VFEQVRGEVGHRRDDHGSLGSINWLRHHMERRGANPNVVRNIIYRDKGKLPDKQALYGILDELWQSTGHPPLRSPELETLLSPGSGQEQEVLQLLGRDKRRAYRDFVRTIRGGEDPKMVIVGRPGSGKTLLCDYIQQALELPPVATDRLIRLEFGGTDLATTLARLGAAMEVPPAVMEARLVKLGSAGAFAVQADAQADVARAILDAARSYRGRQTLLLHVSQSLGGQESLGLVPLRLNDPDVPRVSAAEWLWVSLFEPLARLSGTALLVSMADLPLRAQSRLGAFADPVRLTPPTLSEARRFVRARLPHAEADQHERIVRLAGRSFEELRTLTLLTEIRDPASEPTTTPERSVMQLARAIEGGEPHLRRFLAAVAVLSLPDYPEFGRAELAHLLRLTEDETGEVDGTFLDGVPGRSELVRCFSRELARELRRRLAAQDPATYRALHRHAAARVAPEARARPRAEAANRYLTFLLEARAWDDLIDWMARHGAPQALVGRLWATAQVELPPGSEVERFAQRVAAHYVKLGTFQHPDVRDAFAVMAASSDPNLRAWTALRRAEGLSLRGHHDQADALLTALPTTDEPRLAADGAIARASIARWRGRRDEAMRLVFGEAAHHLRRAPPSAETDAVRVKAALWAGLLAKDQGDLDAALASFDSVPLADDLDAARVAFQRGDVFMRLGHYDRALRAMDEAVALATRSDALASERTRYLARRATVHRRRGDLRRSAGDFQAARTLLLNGAPDVGSDADSWERAFWLARIEDEAGLLLLAEGRFDDAAMTFDRNLRRFRAYADTHGVDATYRVLRSTLRLGIAYGCRAVCQPFRRPFAIGPGLGADTPDLRQARRLIAGVLDRVESDAQAWRPSSLARDALLAANLFIASGREAIDLAERALATSRYPYQRATAHAHAAAGALRIPDPDAAATHVQAATRELAAATDGASEPEQGDPELAAWLVALGTVAAIAGGDVHQAGECLAQGLKRPELRPHHDAMLRQFGEAIEAHGIVDWAQSAALSALLQFDGRTHEAALRLPDALAARWAHMAGDRGGRDTVGGVPPTTHEPREDAA
jgi:tetratricopeptide (TPR) repeat protein